jgi:undecaprenyl diphosphate synthase
VKYVSAYIFSTENWNRSEEEVSYLMDLFVWVATKEVDRSIKEGIRLVFAGSRDKLSTKVLEAIESAEERTLGGDRGVLMFCLNYGGQSEIAEGVARLVRDGVPADEVTVQKLSEYLYHPEIPPVDLLIRTSGEQRLSNFMLWRVAYAELYFTPVLWPAFSADDLDLALTEFAVRRRRFGA